MKTTRQKKFYIELQGDGMPNISDKKPHCETCDHEELSDVAEFYAQVGQYLQQKGVKLWHE